MLLNTTLSYLNSVFGVYDILSMFLQPYSTHALSTWWPDCIALLPFLIT